MKISKFNNFTMIGLGTVTAIRLRVRCAHQYHFPQCIGRLFPDLSGYAVGGDTFRNIGLERDADMQSVPLFFYHSVFALLQ